MLLTNSIYESQVPHPSQVLVFQTMLHNCEIIRNFRNKSRLFTTSSKPMKYTTAVVYTFHPGVRHDPLISENQNKSFLFAFSRTRVWKLQKYSQNSKESAETCLNCNHTFKEQTLNKFNTWQVLFCQTILSSTCEYLYIVILYPITSHPPAFKREADIDSTNKYFRSHLQRTTAVGLVSLFL